jgi:hypothetical protein
MLRAGSFLGGALWPCAHGLLGDGTRLVDRLLAPALRLPHSFCGAPCLAPQSRPRQAAR